MLLQIIQKISNSTCYDNLLDPLRRGRQSTRCRAINVEERRVRLGVLVTVPVVNVAVVLVAEESESVADPDCARMAIKVPDQIGTGGDGIAVYEFG